MSQAEATAPTLVPTPAAAQPAAGVVVHERYELQERLGLGGMAQVWRARDRTLARDVALKIFHRPDDSLDAAARRTAEMQVLARLSHPGLVAIFDASATTVDDQAPYLVMELVAGRTLRQLLEAGPLDAASACSLFEQLATTMAYVHGCGVIHRDLKPANILLTDSPDGLQAKIADFGVARLVDGERLTVHGMTVGTPNYLSPEQARGGELGPPSDVYTLGLVLLEALTGRIAFPGRGIETALARLHRAPEVPHTLEAAWHELIGAMTAADPAQRPGASDVAAALRRIAAGAAVTDLLPVVPVPLDAASGPTGQDGRRAPAHRRTDRRRPVLVGTAAAVAGVGAAALGILLTMGAGTPAASSAAITPSHSSSSAPLPAAPAPTVRTTVRTVVRTVTARQPASPGHSATVVQVAATPRSAQAGAAGSTPPGRAAHGRPGHGGPGHGGPGPHGPGPHGPGHGGPGTDGGPGHGPGGDRGPGGDS